MRRKNVDLCGTALKCQALVKLAISDIWRVSIVGPGGRRTALKKATPITARECEKGVGCNGHLTPLSIHAR